MEINNLSSVYKMNKEILVMHLNSTILFNQTFSHLIIDRFSVVQQSVNNKEQNLY